MKDIRKQQKAERGYFRRDELQQCAVCGRWFTKGKGDVCSMSCKAEAEREGRQCSK
jgi:hypothetical protein